MKPPALFVTGTDRVELIEANIPDPGPREVIVESLYTSISPGTELRCMAGRAARKDLSLHTGLFHGWASHSAGI